MKKIIWTLLCCSCLATAQAQIDTTITVDLLKAPASPAFNMLGIAPSSIQRPTDITAFMTSIQANTGNFTTFPKNYAVEIAPFLLGKTGPTLKDYDSTNFWRHVLPQTFQLSLGISQQNADGEVSEEADAFPRAALGFRVSLVRRPWTKETQTNYDKLHKAQSVLLDKITENDLTPELTALEARLAAKDAQMLIIGTDTQLTPERKRELLTQILPEKRAIMDSISAIKQKLMARLDAAKTVRELATSFEIKRTAGFYLDLQAGMVTDFPDRRFNYSKVSKAGAWLTGGYDGNDQLFSVLAIVRYLYQPDKIFADASGALKTDDVSTFDFGGRVLLNAFDGKFDFSSELIYRSVLNNDIIDPNWRVVLNLEYKVGTNQKLTFGFGKNFDGTITKSGNLIAAFNFIKGFGSKRKT